MWNIYQGFNRLPWEWNQEEPNLQDMNAMEQMMAWHNDRERMDAERAQQEKKRHKSSNTRSTTYQFGNP